MSQEITNKHIAIVSEVGSSKAFPIGRHLFNDNDAAVTNVIAQAGRGPAVLLPTRDQVSIILDEWIRREGDKATPDYLLEKLSHSTIKIDESVGSKWKRGGLFSGYEHATDEATSIAKSPQTSTMVREETAASASKTRTIVTAKKVCDLAEKIRRAKCFRSYFKKSDFPEDVLNTVCLSGILPVLLRTTLGLDPSLLELRPKTDIDFQKRRDIVELWIDSSGETSTLEILLDAVDKGGQWGAVSGALEEKIRSAETALPRAPALKKAVDDDRRVEHKDIIDIKNKVAASDGDVLTFGIVLLKADPVEVNGVNSAFSGISLGDKFANICYKWMSKESSGATLGKILSALKVIGMDKKARDIWSRRAEK